ncbi:hypothetical protein [Paenibacillus sp. NPDC057934]|uniref:hypothetical protein n=1 Tax=Paenibacillus sp. NPDC057934 TaxID=3346282 RepID=UPI0036D9F158
MGTVDFQQLEEKFALTLHELENTVLTIPASDLLIAEHMQHLIDTYGSLIKAREPAATAAFFVSWFAGVCGALQHMLYQGNEVILDLSLSNLTVQLYIDGQYPLFSFKINEAQFSDVSAADLKEEYKRTLHVFYKEQVTPIIQLLSELVPTRATALWGQIGNPLYAQLEEALAAAFDEESRNRMVYLYEWLTQDLDPSSFGLSSNPLNRKPRFIEHPSIPDLKIRMKTACCLAYCLDGEFGYCYECPRLKEKDRAFMRANK